MKVQAAPLSSGDSIELSVTHEIKISGDKSWVGARISTTIRENETTEDAQDRLSAAVQSAVMREVETTVKTVKGYTS